MARRHARSKPGPRRRKMKALPTAGERSASRGRDPSPALAMRYPAQRLRSLPRAVRTGPSSCAGRAGLAAEAWATSHSGFISILDIWLDTYLVATLTIYLVAMFFILYPDDRRSPEEMLRPRNATAKIPAGGSPHGLALFAPFHRSGRLFHGFVEMPTQVGGCRPGSATSCGCP